VEFTLDRRLAASLCIETVRSMKHVLLIHADRRKRDRVGPSASIGNER
jgi:hypothetical protein